MTPVSRAIRPAASWCPRVPDGFRDSLLAARAFGSKGVIQAADVTAGPALEHLLGLDLARPDIAYAHLHDARRSCFAARVDRA